MEKIQFSLLSDKYNGYFTWRARHIFYHVFSRFSLEREIFQTSCRGNQMCSNCVLKSCPLLRNVEKYCRPRQARLQYGTYALHAGYLRLKIHNQVSWYLLLLHCNNGCKKEPQSYNIRTLSYMFQGEDKCGYVAVKYWRRFHEWCPVLLFNQAVRLPSNIATFVLSEYSVKNKQRVSAQKSYHRDWYRNINGREVLCVCLYCECWQLHNSV